jgi:membrane protein
VKRLGKLHFPHLGLSPVVDFIKHYFGGLYHRIGEHHLFLHASGLAFSLFICIIPLILILFAILGAVLERPSIVEEISTFIERAIPYPDAAEMVEDLVLSRVDEFTTYKSVAGLVGIVGLLFAASGLFSSMRTILNKVFHTGEEESVLIGKLRDLGLILLVVVYFLLSIAVLPVWEVINEIPSRVGVGSISEFGFLADSLQGMISFVLIFLSFLIVYFLVPYQRPPKKVVFLSALIAAVLWELAKQLFGFYIMNFATLKRIYGAYALMLIVAFWIYYTSVVFILAAEIGQLYRERRQQLQIRRTEDIPNDAEETAQGGVTDL